MTIIWIGAIAPLVGWYSERAGMLSQQRILLLRTAALIDTIPELQRRATEVGSGPTAGVLLASGNDAIVAAAVQQYVHDIAAPLGISLSSVETFAPEPEGRYRRIRLQFAFSSPLPLLVALLSGIRSARPQMVIDHLDLRVNSTLLHAQSVPLEVRVTIVVICKVAAPLAEQ